MTEESSLKTSDPPHAGATSGSQLGEVSTLCKASTPPQEKDLGCVSMNIYLACTVHPKTGSI